MSHLPKRLLPVASFLTGSAPCSTSAARSRSTTPSTASTGWRVAVAFWALLDLYKRGEVRMVQAEPFAPIRIARVGRR